MIETSLRQQCMNVLQICYLLGDRRRHSAIAFYTSRQKPDLLLCYSRLAASFALEV